MKWKSIIITVVLGLVSQLFWAQDASSWEQNPLPPTYSAPLKITWVNGKFITDNGLISADGKKWDLCDSCIDRSKNISWNGNYYFATGYSQTVHRSTDLENWNTILDNSGESYKGIAWNADVGVVVGNNGVIWSSSNDGLNWNNRNLPGLTSNLKAITWSKGRFFAVGNDGALLQSPDAINWSLQSADPSIDFHFVLTFKGRTYAVAMQANIWAWNESTMTWSEIGQVISNAVQGVACNGSHIALVDSMGFVRRSKDAISWNQVVLDAQPLSGRAITWHGSQWLVSLEKDGVPAIYRSVAPKSSNWSSQSLAHTHSMYDVDWDGRKFLAAGYTWIYSSVDGVNWAPVFNIGATRTATAIAHNHKRTVIVGGTGSIGFTTHSEDSVSWSAPTTHTERLNGIVWTGTYFFAVGNSGLVRRSPDGINWTTMTSPGSENLYAVGFAMHLTDPSHSTLVVVGDNGFISHANPEGANWSTKTSGTTERLLAIDINSSDDFNTNGIRTVVGENGTVLGGNGTSYWSKQWPGTADLVDVVHYNDQVIMADAQGSFIEVDSFINSQFTITETGFPSVAKAMTTDGAQWFICGTSGRIARSHTPFVARWTEERHLTSYPENPGITIPNDVAAGPEGTVFSGDEHLWRKNSSGVLQPINSEGLNKVIWDGHQFVGISSEKQPLRFLTSPDGLSWTYRSDVDFSVYDSHEIAYNGTAYLVHLSWGPEAHRLMRSTDMLNWDLVHSANNLEGPFWVNDQFILGAGPGVVLTSSDGQSWSTLNHNVNDYTLTHLQFLNGTYYATMIGPLSWNVSLYRANNLVSWTEIVDTEAYLRGGNGRQILANLRGETGLYESTNGQLWEMQNDSSFGTSLKWNGSSYFGIESFKYIYNGAAFVSGVKTVIPKAGIGTAWNPSSSPTTSALRGLAFSGTVWVAVGSSGTLLTSSDGLVWQDRDIGETRTFYDIAWNGILFTAVGQSGMTYTSPNGNDWTSRNNATTGWLYGITWDGDQHVAVGGTQGRFVTSPDGITWTYRSDSNIDRMRAITSNFSRTIAVGDAGTIMWSDDGATWTQASSGTSRRLWAVCWRGDSFVAVGDNGTIVTSTNGTFWERQNYYKNYDFTSVAYDGALLRLGTNTGQVISGTDTGSGKGIWSEVQTESINGIGAIAYCGEQWLTVSMDGTILTSNYGADFEFWTVKTGRPAYVQGLEPVIVFADSTAGMTNMEYQWRDEISGQSFSPEAENYMVFENLTTTMELHVKTRESGSTYWQKETMSPILVSENPLYFDYNADQCNDLNDLHLVIQEQWNQEVPSDPNADGQVDIRDLLYINTYGGCP